MEQQTLSPAAVASGVFVWLVPELSNGTTPVLTIPPQTLRQLHDEEVLSVAEVLTIVSYVTLSAAMDHTLAAKAQAVRSVLNGAEEFHPILLAKTSDLLKRSPISVKQLLNAPPPEYFRTITEVVLQYQQREPAQRKRLEGISVEAYQHPGDRIFLDKLRGLAGIETIIAESIDTTGARAHELALLSSAVHVQASTLPWLSDCYREACEVLCVPHPPRLYIAEGGLNAYTTGAHDPIIIVNSGALNLLDRQELLFVLGHELGHVAANHVKYGMVASWIVGASNVASLLTLGLSSILTNTTIISALYAWMRRSEFTADRAGLLACQSRHAALRVMLKFSGYPARFYRTMSVQSMIEQIKEYRERLSSSSLDRVLELNQTLGDSHPRTVTRASEMLEWIDDGSYHELVDATIAQRRQIALRNCDDPQLQELTSAVQVAVIDWCVQEYQIRRSVAGPLVRRMIAEQWSSKDSVLEPLLRIDLHLNKRSANELEYSVQLLVNKKRKPTRIRIELNRDSSFDAAPEVFRHEFIRERSSQISRMLYSCT